MIPVLAVAVFLLVTAGVFLVLQRSLLNVLLGLGCLSHAINLLVLSSGQLGTRAPIVTGDLRLEEMADPIPQAFVLTAIVISMAFTLYLLAGLASSARRGSHAEIVAAPEGDGDLPAGDVLAELTGEVADR